MVSLSDPSCIIYHGEGRRQTPQFAVVESSADEVSMQIAIKT